MAITSVDLNADLGEGIGDDAAMVALVTSANVACGFHAGTPSLLRRTCAEAVAAGVRIGAQVSYPDRDGFGRRFMEIEPDDLVADVLFQIGALSEIARSVGGTVDYVKPHGALYNAIVGHREQARAVVSAVAQAGLPLMNLPGSVALEFAVAAGVPILTEAFADRAYTPQGTLVPRTTPGAVLTDTSAIAERVVRLVTTGEVTAIDGTDVAVHADSVCLHGDTPGAVEHARAVRAALEAAGIDVRAR
ncbi:MULTISPECIES: LamB/YcsF family protein [unclassified Gordonia (in: high G+C Gram-positive bacteria)]|uniref:LamB/YcsF family protein n=1 Tax=unclassified Gordonia (in: high G+C Gram-positive bacteria) TaxID=2657482 RepID=UPI001FFF0BB4|nr:MULTISPECIES: 5-oxoprolinase subunit PxpA [unclassified Gordonia (in: high G+C Gram-positive bacteria)]UQE74647.1 LamB/YcsF family protein [Gordonia sp. PP30]